MGVVYRCGFRFFFRCIDVKVLGCAKFQSVVRSMEVARFSEVAFTLSLCKLQSVPQGLSTVERQSASQRVRYGRFHCKQGAADTSLHEVPFSLS